MEQKKNVENSKMITITLGVIFTLLVAMVVGMKVHESYQQLGYYKIDEALFSFPETVAEYTGINKNQIIRITKDGVTAYNLKGEEVWLDTLTLDNIVVKQREPYFAVANSNGRVIHVFSDKGKECDIVVDNPIMYFSINENGDVAIIQSLKDGHSITAYTKEGIQLNGSRITYIKNAGFPVSVEVSSDSKMLIASYVDIYSPQVTSVIIGMPLGVQQQEKVDNINYGIEIKDNLVYDIEFVTEDIWMAIGDERITYHQLSDGQVLQELPPTYLLKTPYVENQSEDGYVPIVGKHLENGANTFGKELLWIYDANGKEIMKKQFDKSIQFFRADEKGVIVGHGNTYEGYDVSGRQRFSFRSTYGIETMGYIDRHLIAATKNEVFKLQKIEQEMIQ